MAKSPSINPALRRTLIRYYYFNEALAIYQQYYRPLVETYGRAQSEHKDRGRQEDRPLTWVPLVFHCTREDKIEAILTEGVLRPNERGVVSFTEIPIGELDRMKIRHHGKQQVAIGFPRQYIQSLGLAPVWYLKHNTEIQTALNVFKKSAPEAFATLAPFIDEQKDVAAFLEVRTTKPVPIDQAVWILTTNRNHQTGELSIPGIDDFKRKHGPISRSYWHRSHQMGILTEGQFTKVSRTQDSKIEDFQTIGEHYWRKLDKESKELLVTYPVRKEKIIFDFTNREKQAEYEGPWRFIDIAKLIEELLHEAGVNVKSALSYRMIEKLAKTSR
jgi:hypothetical protein